MKAIPEVLVQNDNSQRCPTDSKLIRVHLMELFMLGYKNILHKAMHLISLFPINTALYKSFGACLDERWWLPCQNLVVDQENWCMDSYYILACPSSRGWSAVHFAADAQPISGRPIWPPRFGRLKFWAGHDHAATKHALVFLNMQIVIWNLQWGISTQKGISRNIWSSFD